MSVRRRFRIGAALVVASVALAGCAPAPESGGSEAARIQSQSTVWKYQTTMLMPAT